MKKNTIRTPRQGWEYWRLNRIDYDCLQWLAISRPDARASIGQTKLWTLIPALGVTTRFEPHRLRGYLRTREIP
ncbi:hypothetical protein BVU76_13235 [Mycolicibacterium porcinum]|nr:hypothetical protein BVU76_13235 [Mycolicibacterium porcinum]